MERVFSYRRMSDGQGIRVEARIIPAYDVGNTAFPEGLEALLSAYAQEAREAALRGELILTLSSHIEGFFNPPQGKEDARLLILAYGRRMERVSLLGVSGNTYSLSQRLLLPGFIYVHPEMRQRGIGRLLIEERFRIGRRLGLERALYIPLTLASHCIGERLKETYPYENGAYILKGSVQTDYAMPPAMPSILSERVLVFPAGGDAQKSSSD